MDCKRLGSDLCITTHWVGWSMEAISSSLMIIFDTKAWTLFTSNSNNSAKIGYNTIYNEKVQ